MAPRRASERCGSATRYSQRLERAAHPPESVRLAFSCMRPFAPLDSERTPPTRLKHRRDRQRWPTTVRSRFDSVSAAVRPGLAAASRPPCATLSRAPDDSRPVRASASLSRDRRHASTDDCASLIDLRDVADSHRPRLHPHLRATCTYASPRLQTTTTAAMTAMSAVAAARSAPGRARRPRAAAARPTATGTPRVGSPR